MCRCASIRECGEDVNEPSNMRKVEGAAAFETLVIPGLFGLNHQSHQSSLGMVESPNLNGSNSIYQRDLGAYIGVVRSWKMKGIKRTQETPRMGIPQRTSRYPGVRNSLNNDYAGI